MPSPFPGMDPYIEDPFFWSDFHATMMVMLRESINLLLPRKYIASVERHSWIHDGEMEEVSVLGVPDVQVADRLVEAGAETAIATATPQTIAPATAVLPVSKREGSRFLRILDRHRRRLVTILELLSPANKTKTGYGPAYRAKRNEYLASGVNLVEIDLLRFGDRPPLLEPIPPQSDYYVLICPAVTCPQAGFWPLSVKDLLPLVPIPLDPGEENIFLDIRACMDRAYDAGRYFDEIDYSIPPYYPLKEPDATWARELLARRVN